MSDPLYPDVRVQLTGKDGNVFYIIRRISGALRKSKVDAAKIEQFQTEMMSGDYNNVLQIAMKWVTVL